MRYRLMCGDKTTEPPVNEWIWIVKQGFATVSKHDRKLAHVLPKYRFWVDAQTGILGIALTETPDKDPYAIPSSWYLILRHALFHGVPDEVAMDWACQVEGIH